MFIIAKHSRGTRFANSKDVKTSSKPSYNKKNEGNDFRVKKPNPYVKFIMPSLQLLSAVVLVVMIIFSGLVPSKYIAVISVILFLFAALTFALQFVKAKAVRIMAIVLSVIMTLLSVFGAYFLDKANYGIKSISGAEYQTTNMVVMVRADDTSETILDAINYSFGLQTAMNVDDNQAMLDEIKTQTGTNVNTFEYANNIELANALIAGDIDAAIYNEAYDEILNESIENYSSNVKVLYKYGVTVLIKKEEVVEKEKTEQVKEQEIAKEEAGSFNIYLSGIDTYGDITTKSRSDVNIIMTVNPTTKNILLTTTPRDYYIPIAGVTGSSCDKLTHAGLYGVDVSMATLGELYDTEIDYFARLNFSSFIKIIDTIGGVEVYSAYTFNGRGYQFYEGMNYMDGDMALCFARERYSFTDGDVQRGKNQQAVITAVLKKLMSPSIITQVDQIIADVSGSVQTSMSSDEIAKLLNMQIDDGAEWTIESVSAEAYGSSEYSPALGDYASVMVPYYDSVDAISEKIHEVLK